MKMVMSDDFPKVIEWLIVNHQQYERMRKMKTVMGTIPMINGNKMAMDTISMKHGNNNGNEYEFDDHLKLNSK